jgi:N-acetylneuraminic acid mutarotase
MKNQRKLARHSVSLTLALVSLISVSALLAAPSRHASAQAAASWSYTGSLKTARVYHTATRLLNGKVLIAGGYNGADGSHPPISLNSVELYDPATGSWSSTGSLNTARDHHIATPLQNGKILVFGGDNHAIGSAILGLTSAEVYDPAAETWTYTGALNASRSLPAATLLQNGKVLIAGGDVCTPGQGCVTSNSAELYDPATGIWSFTGNLNTARHYQTATLLPNGKVLIAGGVEGNASGNSAELYDPATGIWSLTGNLNAAFASTATLLQNGKVLVSGEFNCTSEDNCDTLELYDPVTETFSLSAASGIFHTATLLTNGKVLNVFAEVNFAELFDPVTETFSSTANPNTGRYGYTTTLLLNGKVLVAAGGVYGGSSAILNTAELYDPGIDATSTPTPSPSPTPTPTPTATPTATPTPTPTPAGPTWTLTGNLNAGRDSQTATLLPNSKVLVVGGNNSNGTLKSAELYDPATGIWSTTGNLNTSRAFHTATLLPNGKVLVAGGFTCGPPPQICSDISSAELYDPATGTWTSTSSLNAARRGLTATLLSSGKVLVVGGAFANNELNTAELYDPADGTWSVTGNLNVARFDHTSTLLPNGKVIVAGGANIAGGLYSAELYNPTAGTWSITGSLNKTRQLHTATLLPNGRVLVAAGFVDFNTGFITNSAELYDPTTGVWTNTGALNAERAFHTATLLHGGKVLVAGGFNIDGLPNITDSCELYDPATGTWSNTANLKAHRRFHTATLLFNGKVLAVGGNGFNAPNSAELYDAGANPIDDSQFFVRQHYRDFLGREADAPGEAHWTGEITMCGESANRLPGETETQCIDRKRTNTSGAFYLSNEFQNSANFLIRVNWGSLGQDRAPGRKCIEGQHSALDAVCNPLYSQYLSDLATLTQGIVVNDQLNPDAINANKHDFVTQFVTRSNFLSAYPDTMTAGEYVDKLSQTTGIALTTQERADLIAEATTAGGRASVLYKIVDGTTTIDGGLLRFDTRYGKAYYDQEFNPVFVFVEYLGYLRRNPDQAGYDHWLGKLNFYGNFVDAEMVRAFIVSHEYRNRF